AQDEAAAARVKSKNTLKSYTYSLCGSLDDEKLADKFDPAAKLKLESAVNDTIKWLDTSLSGTPSGFPGTSEDRPSIDEAD
ncbi:hypothetical protein B0H14DRAFT_2384322, partial [Mycena olivaceomarginata]